MGLLKKEKTRMIFRCRKTKEEIVSLLENPQFEDNLEYVFFSENGGYCFSVTRLPYQIGKRRPVPYRLWFEQGERALYLLVEEKEEKSVFVTSSQEPEVYRFFIEKCDCEPVKTVE
ncbi:MAG: hypothetical protein Q4C52_11445 [Eubacteriales bacterium]|nr:hypothetical protein [Eubacteriales bacterium]